MKNAAAELKRQIYLKGNKMNEQAVINYDVRLRTPIGLKKGQMTVTRNKGRISGTLDVLKHKEDFGGTIDEEGNCELSGKMVTLMQTINYDATGVMTDDRVELLLIDGCRVFEIKGEACKGE